MAVGNERARREAFGLNALGTPAFRDADSFLGYWSLKASGQEIPQEVDRRQRNITFQKFKKSFQRLKFHVQAETVSHPRFSQICKVAIALKAMGHLEMTRDELAAWKILNDSSERAAAIEREQEKEANRRQADRRSSSIDVPSGPIEVEARLDEGNHTAPANSSAEGD